MLKVKVKENTHTNQTVSKYYFDNYSSQSKYILPWRINDLYWILGRKIFGQNLWGHTISAYYFYYILSMSFYFLHVEWPYWVDYLYFSVKRSETHRSLKATKWSFLFAWGLLIIWDSSAREACVSFWYFRPFSKLVLRTWFHTNQMKIWKKYPVQNR